ncbi:MAG: HAD-IG family 5'-nucleotidase [Polyangiaceae bacterium]|nr:HAD-IG family 5'-nucleotidase [Polyangiaceae bacterium]
MNQPLILKNEPQRPPSLRPQLTLPLPGLAAELGDQKRIPRADRVFVCRNLKLGEIEWVGFDMDYTLAIYDQAAMDALSVSLTVEKLIERGYPRSLSECSYDTRFPIRGLVVDKVQGHVLKMDRYKAIQKGYHGLSRLSRAELQALYHDQRIQPHTKRYHWIDTLFALSEVAAYAAIVEQFTRAGETPDYDRLFLDVRASIDAAHADGSVYKAVTSNLSHFVQRDPDLARSLHKLRSAGKRLFLLTNSPPHYTEQMMTYLLGDAMPEYPSWQHYFDVAICSAKKPIWFQEGSPFLEVSPKGSRPIKEAAFEKGKLYEGGNLKDFERLTKVVGSSVLYVGDHIYGDILRSKKETSWRTAMIIQELDAEISAHEACAADRERQRQIEEAHDLLEDELRYYQRHIKDTARQLDNEPAPDGLSDELVRLKRALERVRAELKKLGREHELLEDRIDQRFHLYWGSLLKEGNEMSMFGLQVETYADIYMRRVSCLRAYSPQQFFRSPHDLMPHEL